MGTVLDLNAMIETTPRVMRAKRVAYIHECRLREGLGVVFGKDLGLDQGHCGFGVRIRVRVIGSGGSRTWAAWHLARLSEFSWGNSEAIAGRKQAS